MLLILAICAGSIAVVQPESLKLSCSDVKTLVDGHNAYRRQLARGEVVGQPKASNMELMVWDDELAAKAEKYAANGVFEHNPNTGIPSNRFTTGENLYTHMTTEKRVKRNMSAPIQSWFQEHRDYKYKTLQTEDFQDNRKMIGHYTQMAWADTKYLGCGLSRKVAGRWTTFLYVCNYGPAGNYVGEFPYKTGAGCEDLCCTSDCDHLYGRKC